MKEETYKNFEGKIVPIRKIPREKYIRDIGYEIIIAPQSWGGL
jgi:hypothetical protein